MRPKSIRLFELFYLASIAMVVASAIYDFSAILASTENLSRRGIDPFTLSVTGIVLAVGFKAILWFMTARLRIGFVRYLIIAVILWEAHKIPATLSNGAGPSDIVAICVVLLQIVAIVFAFTAASRAWYAAPVIEGPADS